ncbi:MAG: peptide chain release factor N(5)-glutamine methyltransferase [Solirubrobacteraceae bacterium]
MPEAVAEPAAGRAPVSVSDALASATGALTLAGCENSRLDAELLLGEALGVTRSALVVGAATSLEAAALGRFRSLLARRAEREPVAYILGRKGFRYITLAVDRRVLIPRPETELLVEVGLELPEGARVMDIGTGSGAVALALKQERPDLVVSATDISSDALALARANAMALGLKVRFAHADLLDGARYDAVLANLPYVAAGAASRLAPEISRYEPSRALLGGPDGLDVVRRLVASNLGGASLVALEVGSDQAAVVSALLVARGFTAVACRRDLAGHERVVVGCR